MSRIKDWWYALDDDAIVNRKLLFFEFLTAVFAGMLLGILITPFKSITIASNNDGCCASASCGCDDEDEDD